MIDSMKDIVDLATGSGIGITDVIGVLAAIAALTPTPVDNIVLVALRKAIDFGAFNFLGAENKKKAGER